MNLRLKLDAELRRDGVSCSLDQRVEVHGCSLARVDEEVGMLLADLCAPLGCSFEARCIDQATGRVSSGFLKVEPQEG